MLKPIETSFRGYRFRSRLEARWAVFFDALGITWEYEPEGFTLSDGTRYLPDFWLPTFDGGMWAEVKPLGGDFGKARQFAADAHVSMWLCEGTPALRAYDYLAWYEDELVETRGIPNADQAEGENRMYAQPGYEREDLSIPEDYYDCLGRTFMLAVAAARSARFDEPDPSTLRDRSEKQRQRAIATFAYRKYGQSALEDHEWACLEEEFNNWLEWKADHPDLYR